MRRQSRSDGVLVVATFHGDAPYPALLPIAGSLAGPQLNRSGQRRSELGLRSASSLEVYR